LVGALLGGIAVGEVEARDVRERRIAATSCYLASNPALAHVTGLYFADCNPAEQSAYQKDSAMAAKLWKVSEELTRPYLI